jgi:SMODS-associating 2TM, beta-strand rich effector domain
MLGKQWAENEHSLKIQGWPVIFSLRNRLKLLIYFGAALLILIGLFDNGPKVAGITFGRLGLVEAGLFAAILLFNRWAWRLPGVVAVLRTGPVLRGTWKGTTTSTYDGQTRTAYIAVRQTFAEIEVRLISEESTSETTSCQLIRRPDGLTIVEYSYANTPRASVRHRSELHFELLASNAPVSDQLA